MTARDDYDNLHHFTKPENFSNGAPIVATEAQKALDEIDELRARIRPTDYDDATDCPICPQIATDRDDALRQIAFLEQRNRDLEEQLAVEHARPVVWMSQALNEEVERFLARQRARG